MLQMRNDSAKTFQKYEGLRSWNGDGNAVKEERWKMDPAYIW